MPLGILTGLASEARIARRLWPGALVACAASRPDLARREAAALISNGATRLLSFGIAGGLAPELTPGALVIGTAVIAGERRLACDPALRESLAAAIPEALLAPLLAAETPVLEAGEKALLHRTSGAFAVDMESLAVAEAAARHGLPFAVLRAIADPAERALPRAALVGVDESGRPAIGPVLLALLGRPQDLPGLVRLGRDSRLAHRSLEGLLGRADLGLLVA